MKRQAAFLIGIGAINLFLFTGLFTLLQNEKIYHHTLGVISGNYERIGGWDSYDVQKVSKPYLKIKNEYFENWDAVIYKCISERMYIKEDDCFGSARSAFFPLFPVLWKITFSSPIRISIINYLLFIVSIACLVLFLLKTSLPDKCVTFALLITLPSCIIYYIPYTEALFLFTTSVAAIGLIKKKYWIFFVGCFLLALVRPATVFVLIAMLFAELLILIHNKNYRSFLNETIFKSLPFIAGYICAIVIQYVYSGTWTAFIEAQKQWGGGIQLVKGISDWSVEGFALSSFALFFVCIPATLFILFLCIGRNKIISNTYISKIKNYNKEYLLLISSFYLTGIFIFTLVTSGGNLHSFFRFTLASPLFYIALLISLDYLFERPLTQSVITFAFMTLLLFLFLHFVDFGGERLQFSFFGLYMFIVTGLFLIIKKAIVFPVQLVIIFVLILLNAVWNTYLLNAFFSNGWLFT